MMLTIPLVSTVDCEKLSDSLGQVSEAAVKVIGYLEYCAWSGLRPIDIHKRGDNLQVRLNVRNLDTVAVEILAGADHTNMVHCHIDYLPAKPMAQELLVVMRKLAALRCDLRVAETFLSLPKPPTRQKYTYTIARLETAEVRELVDTYYWSTRP